MYSTLTLADESIDAEMVARATALRPLLEANAARTESERRVAPEVVDALEEAGLFALVVPKRVGGAGATMATQLAVGVELGRACASTSWVQFILNSGTWAAAMSPAATEILGSSADRNPPRVCAVLAPSGTARPVDGGYVVNGRWSFASGSFCATWFNGGVQILSAAGEPSDLGMVFLPRKDYSIDDTWFVAGMAGTGSNTVVAEDVFVPASRLPVLTDALVEGEESTERWPIGAVLSLGIIGPLIGAAQACADAVVARAPKRAISYTSYSRTVDSMVAVTAVAEALLDIDTAWIHALRAAAYVDSIGAGAARDPMEDALLRGRCGYITQRLRHGVDELLNVAGASSFASSDSVQRHWRDLTVGSRHAFLASNVSLETYGRGLFGLDPTMMVV